MTSESYNRRENKRVTDQDILDRVNARTGDTFELRITKVPLWPFKFDKVIKGE